MTDYIKSDYALNDYCDSVAQEAFDHGEDYYEMIDFIHESIDGCQHVIYHHRAHTICLNCTTDSGEQGVEDSGGFPDGFTYDSMASLIVYFEMESRCMIALENIKDEAESE